ncbi:MAG: hypothetical protein WC052_01615 [Patescibacteria group bacterium]
MNKATLYALIGAVLYGTQSAVIEMRLKELTPTAVLLCFYIAMLPVVLAILAYKWSTGTPIIWPQGGNLYIAGAMGIAYFWADWFTVAAYNTGGDVATVTGILMLVPIIASVIKLADGGTLPNIWQVAAYLTMAVSVGLFAKGLEVATSRTM